MDKPKILVLDDEPGFRDEIGEFLTHSGYDILPAGLPSEALQLLEKNHIDVALFDVRLPEMDGLTLLGKVREKYPAMDVVIMTGFGSMDTVIKALRWGASDFLRKPFKFIEVQVILDRLLQFRRLNMAEPQSLKGSHIETDASDIKIIGESKGIADVLTLVRKVAASNDLTVLITGDSGTGKELVARTIHHLSKRRDHNFVAVNCSNIPEELFENEFFGHMKGSFTDAKSDQKGWFEAADKGTLFLDEIGDLKLSLQSKLLRVIEDKRISRIGAIKESEVDIRVVAATNQDLSRMIEQKCFRSDLYHRLNLFSIHIPPLCERKEDIPVLTDYFFAMFAKKHGKALKKIDRSVYQKLMEYNYPGNVRELKNMIERAVILCECDIIDGSCFALTHSMNITDGKKVDIFLNGKTTFHLEDVEKKLIMMALEENGFNKSQTAIMLHITRQALDRKIAKYKIRTNKK